MFSLLRPYIFSLDPEAAHDLAIKSLKLNVIPKSFVKVDGEEMLEIKLFKKKLKNPIGLAAGFDKSAEVYNSLFKLGFGFIEVGTITPRRQTGNPKPRIFRLEKDKAMINRLGFNNDGMEIVSERLAESVPEDFLGINIGPNKDTKDKTSDFIKCFDKLNKLASYITINISSPNTEGLRDFHEEKLLSNLLSKLSKRLLSSETFALKILSLILNSFDPFGPFKINLPLSTLIVVSFGIKIGFFPSLDIIIKILYK